MEKAATIHRAEIVGSTYCVTASRRRRASIPKNLALAPQCGFASASETA
jgi:hypothetical protein